MAHKVKGSPYSVSPSVKMVQNWVESLPEKTGKTLEEWVTLIHRDGPHTEKERREWLKTEHQLGTRAATFLAERCDGPIEHETPESYLLAAERWVEEMYSGKKSALRPIHEALLVVGQDLGRDVRICPCSTIVPFYRNHVFAQIKPATNTRVDLGYAIGDMKPTGRLIDTGGFAKKDRITHRIPITRIEEIDDEVRHWLKVAYDRDAKA